jgi:hypothetical protein
MVDERSVVPEWIVAKFFQHFDDLTFDFVVVGNFVDRNWLSTFLCECERQCVIEIVNELFDT